MHEKEFKRENESDVVGSQNKLPSIEATRYSFFQAMRDIEIAYDAFPRLGHALSPSREPLRVKQSAELGFAPHTVSKIDPEAGGAIELEQRFIGLLGPGGPFPLHLSELVRNRARHAGDEALQSFLDLFHHRVATLFYRAWSSSRAIVQSDRPDDDRWQTYVASLVGIGFRSSSNRDALNDASKAFFAGHLAGFRRNREGLESTIRGVLNLNTQVQPFALRWLPLPLKERTSLRQNNQLGRSTVLGEKIPDRQSNIDIKLGPIDQKGFCNLLPGSNVRNVLRDIVRGHSGLAMEARVTVSVVCNPEDSVSLGRAGQLGRTAWIGSRESNQVRNDYSFDLSTVKNESNVRQVSEALSRRAA